MEKQVLQVGTSKTKQLMKQLTLWLLRFLLFISNSGGYDQPQMVTKKFKTMASVQLHYERVTKAFKHQAPDAAGHEFNAIGRCDMNSRSYTCYDVKNCRLL